MILLKNWVMRLIFFIDEVIFKKFSISWFHNFSVIWWTIKPICFRPFSISNEIPTNGPRIQLLFLWIIDSYFRWASYMCICHKLSFQPLNNSNGIFGIALVGTPFNIYTIILRASIHKDLERLKLLSIVLTISNYVQFLLSIMPFWFGEPSGMYLATIPFSWKNLANEPSACPSSAYCHDLNLGHMTSAWPNGKLDS